MVSSSGRGGKKKWVGSLCFCFREREHPYILASHMLSVYDKVGVRWIELFHVSILLSFIHTTWLEKAMNICNFQTMMRCTSDASSS